MTHAFLHIKSGDTHSHSTAAGVDSESGSGSTGVEVAKSLDIGVVNTAYFVSLGFVTSAGDSEDTNLIEVCISISIEIYMQF